MISPERTKEIFVALKLHFGDGTYNFQKYRGKTKAKLKDSEKYAAERISLRFKDEATVTDFFVANMLETFLKEDRFDSFIAAYAKKEKLRIYEEWASFFMAYSYALKQEWNRLDSSLIDMVKIGERKEHPKIFVLFMDGKVSFNLFATIASLDPRIIAKWRECDDEFLFGKYLTFLENYLPFIKDRLSREKLLEIFKKSS